VLAQFQFLQELKELFSRKGDARSAEKGINSLCVLCAFLALFAVTSQMSQYRQLLKIDLIILFYEICNDASERY